MKINKNMNAATMHARKPVPLKKTEFMLNSPLCNIEISAYHFHAITEIQINHEIILWFEMCGRRMIACLRILALSLSRFGIIFRAE